MSFGAYGKHLQQGKKTANYKYVLRCEDVEMKASLLKCYSTVVPPYFLFLGHLKISNDISACCSTIVIYCAIDDKLSKNTGFKF
jgi:hypothetical protein